MQNINKPLAISSIIAISLHALLFILLTLTPATMTSLPKKRLHVTTVKLKQDKRPIEAPAEKPATTVAVAQPVVKKEKPIAAPKKNSKKVEPKPQIVKKEKTKEAPSYSNDLLAKAKESLKRVDVKPHKTTPIAQAIEVEDLAQTEIVYQEALVEWLESLLRLPELGDINLKVTIAKDGTIKKLEILSSESSANRNYIEKTLPQHTMPPLDKQFGSSHTFTITMKGA